MSRMNPRSVRAAFKLFASLVMTLFATAAAAQEFAPGETPRPAPIVRRILLDRTLRETPVRLVKLDAVAAAFVGIDEPPDAPARTRPIADLLAILSEGVPRIAPSDDEESIVRLVRTDGQRIVGKLQESGSGAEQSVRIASQPLGTVTVPIDDVLRIEMFDRGRSPSVDRQDSGTDDLVELANGDLLRGFVEGLGPTVSIKTEGAADITAISFERVRSVRLANTPRPATGMRLWLTDGSSVNALKLGDWSESGVGATLASDAGTVHFALDALAAVCFDSSRLVALAGIAPSEYRPSSDRRWTRPPTVASDGGPFGAATVLLPGPMTVEWPLARGASAFAAWAELAPATDSWGDCTVSVAVVASDGTVHALAAQRLNYQSPQVRLQGQIPAGAARLRIDVESGPRGPILDRVMLKRAFILFAPAK